MSTVFSRLIQVLIVARLPAMMRNDNHLDAGGADGPVQPAEIVEKPDFVGDRLDTRIDLAARRQEIVVGVDEEQGGPLAWIGGLGDG